MAIQDTLDQLQNFDFNDLDVNNIGSWPKAVKIIIMILVAALVIGGGYYNLDAYRKQKEEMTATFGALLRQLPSDTEVPGLLEDITRAALDNELIIESIQLEPERATEFYRELPIKIAVEGDYHKLGSFVSAVANLSRIVTLHDFKIKPERSVQNLKMSIDAKTYRYLDAQ